MPLQSWAEYLEQSKENKQHWTESETSDNRFCVIFDRCCKSYLWKEEWVLDSIPTQF